MLNDKNPARVSACPVHFIWDGRGRGRSLVRAGFLGFLATGIAFTGALALRIDVLNTAGIAIGATALTSWGLGQVVSYLEARQHRAPTKALS